MIRWPWDAKEPGGKYCLKFTDVLFLPVRQRASRLDVSRSISSCALRCSSFSRASSDARNSSSCWLVASCSPRRLHDISESWSAPAIVCLEVLECGKQNAHLRVVLSISSWSCFSSRSEINSSSHLLRLDSALSISLSLCASSVCIASYLPENTKSISIVVNFTALHEQKAYTSCALKWFRAGASRLSDHCLIGPQVDECGLNRFFAQLHPLTVFVAVRRPKWYVNWIKMCRYRTKLIACIVAIEASSWRRVQSLRVAADSSFNLRSEARRTIISLAEDFSCRVIGLCADMLSLCRKKPCFYRPLCFNAGEWQIGRWLIKFGLQALNASHWALFP